MKPMEELKPCRHAYEPRLCLELRQPTRLIALAIPENQPGIAGAVPLRLRMSNRTSEPVPFGIYGTLIPELVRADGQVQKPREPVGRQLGTGEHDCFLLMKGKWQISISLNTKLRWHDNVLQLLVPALPDSFQVPLEPENYWSFEALEPGSYQLRFICNNPRGVISWWEPKTGRLKKGEAKMALKKVEVIETRAITAYGDLRLFYPTELNCSAMQMVDGVGFETIMLERVLRVPDNQPEARIYVNLGIRITNNTPNSLYFSFYSAFIPTLITPDSQIIQAGYASDWLVGPKESDFSLAMPGEAVTFFPSAFIYRVNDWFGLFISVGNGGWWRFDDLHSGTYQIQLKYGNHAPVVRVDDEGRREKKQIENIWTGVVTMPPMEFSLVYF